METEDRCRVVDGVLCGCSRVRALPPRDAHVAFAHESFTNRVLCRACGADVTAAIDRSLPRETLGPAVPATVRAVTAEKPSPDIGLLLELTAERRAIADALATMAEATYATVMRTRADTRTVGEWATLGESMGYREAARMVRARIVAIPAEAETVTLPK